VRSGKGRLCGVAREVCGVAREVSACVCAHAVAVAVAGGN